MSVTFDTTSSRAEKDRFSRYGQSNVKIFQHGRPPNDGRQPDGVRQDKKSIIIRYRSTKALKGRQEFFRLPKHYFLLINLRLLLCQLSVSHEYLSVAFFVG